MKHRMRSSDHLPTLFQGENEENGRKKTLEVITAEHFLDLIKICEFSPSESRMKTLARESIKNPRRAILRCISRKTNGATRKGYSYPVRTTSRSTNKRN